MFQFSNYDTVTPSGLKSNTNLKSDIYEICQNNRYEFVRYFTSFTFNVPSEVSFLKSGRNDNVKVNEFLS